MYFDSKIPKALKYSTINQIHRLLKDKNLKTKVHIGEFSNYQSIKDAIMLINPDEIQHGIKAAESKKTMDMIKETNIQLNIYSESNI